MSALCFSILAPIVHPMALYHTHRPQNFSNVIGQEHIVTTLENQVKTNKVAHAYLFSGSRGIGKTTTARILAKSINCEKRKENKSTPCDDCQSCTEIAASRSIDVIEIDAASNTGVDNVRTNIIENAQFKPTKSKYKIFIIDEVHMLSTSAFNALLKIMEEPPEHVMFILATTELHKLPETIISRCQRFDFKRISFDILVKHLKKIAKTEKISIDTDVLERIVNKSEGSARDAVSLLEQIIASGADHITSETAAMFLPPTQSEQAVSLAIALLHKKIDDAFLSLYKNAEEQSINYTHLIDQLVLLIRGTMILHSNGAAQIAGVDINPELQKQLKESSIQLQGKDIVQLMTLLLKRRAEMNIAPLPQLPLEMLIIEWCEESNTELPPKPENVEKSAPVEEKPIQEKPVVQTTQASNTQTKDTVEAIWPTFIATLEDSHPSLVFIIKMASIISVESNVITLAVQYSFHQEKLMQKKSKDTIQNCLSGCLDSTVEINIILEDGAKQDDKPNQELQELASLVGGQIV